MLTANKNKIKFAKYNNFSAEKKLKLYNFN